MHARTHAHTHRKTGTKTEKENERKACVSNAHDDHACGVPVAWALPLLLWVCTERTFCEHGLQWMSSLVFVACRVFPWCMTKSAWTPTNAGG
mgnify:CR=1 FL=1